jgi:hypothetical protein
MNQSLTDLIELVEGASSAAEVFGPLTGDQAAALRQRYRELAGAAHPDRHLGQEAAAHMVFTAIQRWHDLALRQLAEGAYGAPARIRVSVGGRTYEGYAEPLSGDLCELFPASAGAGPVLLKVARSPRNNDLLEAEAQALRRIERELSGMAVRAHFATLADSFVLADEDGVRRQVNVIRSEPNTLSLSAVLGARPQGLDPADAAWIFNRMLAAIASAHQLGLVHGAVNPDHVLIRPADHNGILIDWCYSVERGAPLQAICPAYAADYPPEVAAREPATPATDIYMAARCMCRLLGGAGDPDGLPGAVPPSIRALLRTCLIPSPHRRPDDAWQLFDDMQRALRDHYGPPTFRPFPLAA